MNGNDANRIAEIVFKDFPFLQHTATHVQERPPGDYEPIVIVLAKNRPPLSITIHVLIKYESLGTFTNHDLVMSIDDMTNEEMEAILRDHLTAKHPKLPGTHEEWLERRNALHQAWNALVQSRAMKAGAE